MNFPIKPYSPEEKLAHAIMDELIIEGFDSGLALPFAMKIMKIINDSNDDPMIGVKAIKEEREKTDKWWVSYWPKKKYAKAAKKRLESQEK